MSETPENSHTVGDALPDQVWQNLMKIAEESKTPDEVITGTPGAGKSIKNS